MDPVGPGEKMQAVFDRGSDTEVVVLAELESLGYVIDGMQDEVIVEINDDVCVMGHTDGLISHTELWGTTRRKVLEIKRMNDAYWRVVKEGGWHVDGLMSKYRWQVSSYMVATGNECAFVAKNGETGELLWLFAEEPFYTREQLRARVMQVEAMARGFTVAGDYECDNDDYPCPFFYTHTTKKADEGVEVLNGEEAERVEALATKYADAKRRERDAKAEAKRLGSEIRGVLGSREKIAAGVARVTSYTGTSTRFNWGGARDDGIDVDKYRSVSSYDALRVTIDEIAGDSDH